MIGHLPAALAGTVLVCGCGPRVIEVERIVEREVTKVVRETVLVQRSPEVIEKTIEVEKVVTVTPAPRSPAVLVAHGTMYGWTQFATQMVPTFQEMFPHIAIEWVTRSHWGTYERQIAARAASDELGDLVECPLGVAFEGWSRQGLFRRLDRLIVADPFDTRGIFPSALAACEHQGTLHGLPFMCHPGDALLVYRQDLVEAVGVEPPTHGWTLDDLSLAASALTGTRDGSGHPERYGLALRYRGAEVLPMLHLNGAELISEDGRTTMVESPQVRACLGWARDLIHCLGAAPTPKAVTQGAFSLLRSGGAAMMRHTLQGFLDLQSLMGEDKVAAAAFPQHPETGRRATLCCGMAYCIPQRSELAEQAWQWIKFISSREMGAQMFLGGYSYPGSRLASWTDPRVLDLLPLCAQVADILSTAPTARLPWNLRQADCLEAWTTHVWPLLRGEATVDQVIATLGEAIDDVLAQPLPELFG